jgi:hypothetical protein
VDFLIKWHPRKKDPVESLDYAEEHAVWGEPGAGKRVALLDVMETRRWRGYEYRVRRVERIIERTIDKHDQALLLPEIELEGWWTSLDLDQRTSLHCTPITASRSNTTANSRPTWTVSGCRLENSPRMPCH